MSSKSLMFSRRNQIYGNNYYALLCYSRYMSSYQISSVSLARSNNADFHLQVDYHSALKLNQPAVVLMDLKQVMDAGLLSMLVYQFLLSLDTVQHGEDQQCHIYQGGRLDIDHLLCYANRLRTEMNIACPHKSGPQVEDMFSHPKTFLGQRPHSYQ